MPFGRTESPNHNFRKRKDALLLGVQRNDGEGTFSFTTNDAVFVSWLPPLLLQRESARLVFFEDYAR